MNEDALVMWKSAIDLIVGITQQLPAVWPAELPPEGTPGFWMKAARLEMQTRDSVSAALRKLADGQAISDPEPLLAWFLRRRFEWAAQVAYDRAMEGVIPTAPAGEVLEWLLVGSWDSDGCIGFWNHAQRESADRREGGGYPPGG